MSAAATGVPEADLSVSAQLQGARLLIMGGTGFLGKVFVCLLLARFPELAHIYLVVRPRLRADGGVKQDSEARFWAEVASSPVFDPLREQYPGAAFDAFLRQKVTAVPGDVSEPMGGLPASLREALRGQLSAFVNVAGVVNFTPPLDYALNANAFGMQNLVAMARDLSTQERPLPFLHTSTCYVAGGRTGQVDEVDPLDFPFPRAEELDRTHWSPDREIAECVDLVDNTRHRVKDAFRQSHFLDQARQNLQERGEPCRGTALEAELAKVKRKYEEKQLTDQGMERAKYWGWPNTYTYTKSLGEQILRGCGLPHTIVRPAVIESAQSFPSVGWNEGINTSAPMIYMALQGPVQFAAGPENVLDMVPVDQVAFGMVLALAELLEGRHQVVYQLGTSDTNPLEMLRIFELVAMYKRRYYKQEAGGNPLINALQARLEPQGLPAEQYYGNGPRKRAEQVRTVRGWVSRLAQGAAKPLVEQATKQLDGLARSLDVQAYVGDQFVPFTATHNYRFSCANVRAARARLSPEEQALLPWAPESIDWRHYMVEVHIPGLQKNVSPQIEEKLKKPRLPLQRHDDLVALLDELAVRHGEAPALLRLTDEGLVRLSYRQLRARALAVAVRLAQAGVAPGDRVLLSGKNHPDWPVAFFGVLRAGAVVVPLDPALEPDKAAVIAGSAGPRLAILDAAAADAFGAALAVGIQDLHSFTDLGAVGSLPELAVKPGDLAALLYTSGTTGDPKGVMLSHGNLTSMIASLGRLFPLTEDDRVLSVLPLHHAFELSCGLLLPLSLGARIVYLDRVDAERLTEGLQEGRITAMVGVPALWQLLERKIKSQVKDRGQMVELAFEQGLSMNRSLARSTGVDLGRLLFGTVHSRFGGNIRMLISGGAALPRETQELFVGLGLPMAEGYGLTEAAPVLTVAEPKFGAKSGTVGKAIPGVEIRIHAPDGEGVGEVQARGPNVMQGYFGNTAATQAVMTADGWLRTGDLGRLDHQGRLTLVGRAKEVVVTAAGENIYLDDVEASLGSVGGVEEYVLVGYDDPRGGERLGMLARPEAREGEDLARAHHRARAAIEEAVARLPALQRPAAIHLVDAPLPRTATRKVQRKEARVVLERLVAASEATRGGKKGEGLAAPVARAIAAVAGVQASAVHPDTVLAEELGFDSLMWVELGSALEGVGQGVHDMGALQRCRTAAEVVALVGAPPPAAGAEEDKEAPIEIPALVAEPFKLAMAEVQRRLNGEILGTRVLGRAFIPQNRNSIVVANHSSHLDMGLVKYALGPYGEGLVSLAAQDYFFEGNRWKVAYFEHLTNVRPLDRTRGFRQSLRQATEAVEEGQVVLLFPEGTRQSSGSLGEFKPLVGKLALDTGTDILPVFIDGAFDAMPKGAWLPRKRGITVRIGPPLEIAWLREHTRGHRGSEAARMVTALARTAVERLSRGQVLDLSRLDPRAELGVVEKPATVEELTERAFQSLPARFDPARVERPLTWYFSLGELRWTVVVDESRCEVREGRPAGAADCVVKTSADMLVRIVQDRYVPEPGEFMSGKIKTSDIPLLIEFSRVFALAGVDL